MALVLSLSACSSGGDSGSSDGSSSGSDGEERVITWMTVRSDWAAMNKVADQYMEENPDAKIEFEVISDRSSYNQKLTILASSGELPDLFDSEADSTLEEIAGTGVLLDIDELYEELDYTDNVMEIGKNYARLADGKLYSLSWENNVEYFWYHKDLFEQAGITETPKTFDEFLQVCQQLKDAGITPIATWPGWESYRWMAFIPYRLTGNEYIDSLKTGEASFGDDAGIQAAEFFQTLGTEYFQPGWSTSDYTNALETFMSSNAAIYYIGSWQFSSFLDENGEIKDDYGYFKLPTTEGAVNGETAMFANAGTGTCVNKEKYDDQLKDFLQYVLENYPNVAFNESNTLPPMTFEAEGGMSQFWQSVVEDCESMEDYAKTWDVTLDAATVETLSRESTNLGMGEITPEEFAERMDSALQANVSE